MTSEDYRFNLARDAAGDGDPCCSTHTATCGGEDVCCDDCPTGRDDPAPSGRHARTCNLLLGRGRRRCSCDLASLHPHPEAPGEFDVLNDGRNLRAALTTLGEGWTTRATEDHLGGTAADAYADCAAQLAALLRSHP